MRYYFSDSFIKAYVVGAHMNCLDLSIQFKWVPTASGSYKKADKEVEYGLLSEDH